MIWIEGVDVKFPVDDFYVVCVPDVEGEGSDPDEVARFGSKSAVIFELM